MSKMTSAAAAIAAPAPPADSSALTRWLRRDGFAILDQALFYGANFVANVLLARWLGPSAYGAFAVGLSIFYLAGALHTAVLTEPMMVFGGRKYAGDFQWYVGLLLKYHWPVAGIGAVAIAAGAFLIQRIGSPAMANALWGVAAATPFILYAWFVRPACYVRRVAQWAALGSGVYAIVVLGIIAELEHAHALTPLTGFGAMGAASLIGALATTLLLGPHWRETASERAARRGVFADHWAYGSWNAIATVAQWSSSQILIVLTPIFLNLEAAAAIGVMSVLMRPLFPVIRSITPLMLPRVTSEIGVAGRMRDLRRYVLGWLGVCGGGALLYGLAVTIFYEPIARHFFGGKYHGYASLVLLFGLAYAASAAVQVMSVVIRAAGQTRLIALIWSAPGVVTLLLALPAFMSGSLVAVVGVFALSYWVALAIAIWKGAASLTRAPEAAAAEG